MTVNSSEPNGHTQLVRLWRVYRSCHGRNNRY